MERKTKGVEYLPMDGSMGNVSSFSKKGLEWGYPSDGRRHKIGRLWSRPALAKSKILSP
jgi:hypothetical protein